ncbi:subtilase [Colletotrichum karsti]|uniref:Subtilase n=1 Tax=Colletotrichum karsti TaxID=1095194 RepID=A0A9P6HZK7_9PEZI|nr:subtilase [Colletotrichum karsti]KAF9871296.1 subtilase [Colletotrichum karsti]
MMSLNIPVIVALAAIVYGPTQYTDVFFESQLSQRFVGRSGVKVLLSLSLILGVGKWLNNFFNKLALNHWRLKAHKGWAWDREIAVITGGCGGIGRELVLGLVKKGVKVAVLDVIPLPADMATERLILYVETDITSAKAVANAAQTIRDSFGNPTILINNAGIASPHTILETPAEFLPKIFGVNTVALWIMTKEFLPSMIEQNKGQIVNISSLTAYMALPSMVDYCASKAASLTFHEGLNCELKTKYKADGIITTIVQPSWVRTPMSPQNADEIERKQVKMLSPKEVADRTLQQKFDFHVSDYQIEEFQNLLKASKIGSETWYNQQNDTQFGTTRQWLAEAKEAWHKLDWRETEQRLKSFPNFNISIEDGHVGKTNIHFIALFSANPDALPLLFLHGWPGSVLEFLPLLDLLMSRYTPETLPYHVVVPSLPHYGLSGGPLDVELTLDAAARLMNKLMLGLGFGSGYVVQGGDIGSFIARILSATYEECKAFHINMLAPGSQDEILPNANITTAEAEHVQRMFDFSSNGSSYILEHGLRPSTTGLVLASNPLAMLAWIGEKLIEWPDSRYPLPLDTILTLVSFYWYTDTLPRSLYPYRALAAAAAADVLFTVPTSREKPFGYSVFPAENILMPQAWAQKAYSNLAYYKRNDKASSDNATGRYIVEIQPSTILARQDSTVVDSVVDKISSLGYDAKVKQDFTSISGRFQGVSVEITNKNSTGALDDIKSVPGVVGAWPVYPIALDVSFEVTSGSQKWNPHIATRVNELHERNFTGSGQRVCVVDSGVDVAHPALAGKVAGGKNLFDTSSTALTDCAGHGTFVSSVIAASHKDFSGVAPDSEIYMYKVFGCDDTTSNDMVLKGMLAADSDGCDIISVSIGSNTGYANSVLSRVASEIAQDRLIIIAAGNSGEMGPYFASSPAAGRGVISVGSVEASQTMGWPATLVSSSGKSLDISYVTSDGTKFNETIDVPISLDSGDSCNIAGSGSENTAVLAKRGVCPPAGSYASIASVGFSYGILFDSYKQGAYYMSDVTPWSDTLRLMAVTTASVGDWAASQAGRNHTLHLRIQGDAQPAAFSAEVPSSGQISSYTSWGPTYENGFSPIISAPGGVVYGAFPDNKFAISSGTSFATPYISGVAALWYAHAKKDRAEFVRRLTSTAVALPGFNNNDGRVVSEVASLAQQGAGLVDAAKLFDSTTVLLSEPTLSLNDTDNRVNTHTIRIQNTGTEEVTYNISHIGASTVSSRNVLLYPNVYYPPTVSVTGSLAEAKTVVVAPGATEDIVVTILAPEVTADSGALWSGKILLAGSNDDLVTVPYIGIEASTYNWTPLHHGPESYRYDDSNGDLLPVDYQGKAYRPAEGDSPETYFAFRYGTYEFSLDLVGVDWTTDQFSYPPQHGSGSKAWLGSVRSQPIVPGNYMDFPMREIVRFSQGSFVTFRSFANGTDIPSGRYRIFTRALRIFGEASNPKDWQLFLSDPFSIQLGNDPVPGQNATFTTRLPSSTVAATPTSAVSAATTSAVTTTAPVSVPGTTSTLTATATPTGLSGAFTSLQLQRLRESTPFINDPEAWMELHVQISLPTPVAADSILTFAVPSEITDIAEGDQLSAAGALAGSTSFNSETRLYTITLGDWTTWNKNMIGDFFLMCRFTPEFAASMKQGTYVVQFPTVGRVHEATVYYTAVDRSVVYDRISTTPYDGTSLFTVEAEIPASLGPWDYVRLETSHATDNDGFVCDNSSVIVGHEFDTENRITSFTDVTDEAVEICNVKNFRAVYNHTLTGDDVLRFTMGSIQGDRQAWTLNVVYLLDVQLSNGTLVLYDARSLAFERNPRLRNKGFDAFSGERATEINL